MLTITSAARTHRGNVRTSNEDSMLVTDTFVAHGHFTITKHEHVFLSPARDEGDMNGVFAGNFLADQPECVIGVFQRQLVGRELRRGLRPGG